MMQEPLVQLTSDEIDAVAGGPIPILAGFAAGFAAGGFGGAKALIAAVGAGAIAGAVAALQDND